MIQYKDPCPDVMDDGGPAPAAVAFRLCNFATGKPDLLAAHYVELKSQILDASWPHSNGWIDIVGFASKLGYAHNPQGNLQLSRARCAAVQAYLAGHLPRGFRFNVIEGEGDTQSQAGSLDAGFYRAVEVRLFAQSYRPANPTKKHQPIPRHPHQTPSNLFVFQAIEVGSVGMGPWVVTKQADQFDFKLTDTTNGKSRYFRFSGDGLSGGLSLLPISLSSAWDSPERPVIATPMPIRDFADFQTTSASLTLTPGVSAPGASYSPLPNYFQFLPDAYDRRGIHNRVDLKFSFSQGKSNAVGASKTSGFVIMLPESYRPKPRPL